MSARGRARAILRGRCPVCFEGRVFAGLVRMNARCSSCGLVFEREPGYFLGAMYFSYGLALALAAPLVIALLLAGVPSGWIVAAAGAELVLAAPFLFRWARVLWLHLDHGLVPQDDPPTGSAR